MEHAPMIKTITSPGTVRRNYHLGNDLAKQVDELRFTKRFLDMSSTMRAILKTGLDAAGVSYDGDL